MHDPSRTPPGGRGRSPVSRRHVMAGLVATAVTGTCRGQAAPPPAARSRPVQSLSRLGVDRFSSTDQWSRLKAAFAAAHEGGFDLIGDPDANYRHDGPMSLDGVSFDGQGCTFTPLSDGPQVLRCIGRHFRIANVRLLGAATTRSPDNWYNGIWIGDEANQPAIDFVVENVTVDRVAPGRGVATAGFMFNNAYRGRIIRPIVRHSLADGIHCTNGSSDLVFDRPLSESTGDDGFAVVSYRRHGQICRNIRVTNGISRDSAARGFSVVGGLDIIYDHPIAERASAAGLYLFGEVSYDTYGVARATVIAPVLRGCVTGRDLPPEFNQGAITIGGRGGDDFIAGEHVARGATDCVVRDPVIAGVGTRCWSAILLDEFAVRPRISNAILTDIIPPPGSALQPNGLHIGGRDVTIDHPRMTNIAGLPIVITRTASGRCAVNAPQVDGSRLRGAPVNSVIYAEAAPHLDQLTVRDGVFRHGPQRLAVTLLPDSKVRLLNNRVQ